MSSRRGWPRTPGQRYASAVELARAGREATTMPLSGPGPTVPVPAIEPARPPRRHPRSRHPTARHQGRACAATIRLLRHPGDPVEAQLVDRVAGGPTHRGGRCVAFLLRILVIPRRAVGSWCSPGPPNPARTRSCRPRPRRRRPTLSPRPPCSHTAMAPPWRPSRCPATGTAFTAASSTTPKATATR